MRDSKNIQLLKKTHGAPFAVKGIVDSGKLLNYYFNNESDVIQKNTGPKVLKIEKDHLLLRPILESMQEKLLSFAPFPRNGHSIHFPTPFSQSSQ